MSIRAITSSRIKHIIRENNNSTIFVKAVFLLNEKFNGINPNINHLSFLFKVIVIFIVGSINA